VSPAIERILEYDQSELIGDHITENMHPNDCERATKLFDELAAGRESAVKSVEYRYKRAGAHTCGFGRSGRQSRRLTDTT